MNVAGEKTNVVCPLKQSVDNLVLQSRVWRVEVKEKPGIYDVLGDGIHKGIEDLGITSIKHVAFIQVYLISGTVSDQDIELIARELLTDRVTQEYQYYPAARYNPPSDTPEFHVVEISYNAGVMDPVEESTLKGIRDLGIGGVTSVSTAKQFHLTGRISLQKLKFIIEKVLANKLIQHVKDFRQSDVGSLEEQPQEHDKALWEVVYVDILKADDAALMKLSTEGQLFLNLDEMKSIQQYFRKLKRNPTDCELETIAQTWSEHCQHKTFRGNIQCVFEENGKKKKLFIRNLLKSTIIKATEEINKPWCVSVFHDNAGVIEFDGKDNLCFKVETHSHPSALEPFGGANTGIGGVIRDILGTGLGGKPIGNTNVFCFATPEFAFEDLPPGTLHPKRIMKGVVSGVRDYGNKMGIPTINGAILFDDRFVGNPVVFCGTLGLLPRGFEKKQVRAGDHIVVVGGRTGRDGIHGATFSSGELTSKSEIVSSSAVQIGHPIQEKKVLDCLLQARDQRLYSAITDCGAGGLSSAVGEMGAELGAHVDLEKVPLKYSGLSYEEIWISESQERMVMAVPSDRLDKFLAVFAAEDVEASVIGRFTSSGKLELFYHGRQVSDLDMDFLHEGIEKVTKQAKWSKPKKRNPQFTCPKNLTARLLSALSHYNVCSKEWVIRQYDHEVQGAAVLKPLGGINCDAPMDAAVLAPKYGGKQGIAVANGINVRFGMIDPFEMAASCIDEAIRQIVAVGGDPEKIALLDNFAWGNPDKPDRLGGMVRAALGCYKTAVGYGTPFISGKDSLYNEYSDGEKSIAIPGTILISAVGIVSDITRCVTMDFKRAGHLIYMIGETREELGGSIYFDLLGTLGLDVPRVNTRQGKRTFSAVHKAVREKFIVSLHDCSEGGMAVSVSEMAFGGGLGATVLLGEVPYKGKRRNDFILFSESNTRFIAEVPPENRKDFETHLRKHKVPFGLIGRVEATADVNFYGIDQRICVKTNIGELKQAWQKTLKW